MTTPLIIFATGVAVELTIATGIITLGTNGFYIVDTENDDSADDLDTINGGYEGQLVILRAANDDRTVVIKHNTGNIWMPSAVDIALDNIRDAVILFYDGTKWIALNTFASGAGSGDVVGPSGAVNNNIAIFDATTGKLIKDSGKAIASLQATSDNHALADGKSILINSTFATDHTASGIAVTKTAGTNLVFGNVCYIGSDGKMELADADAAASMPVVYLALATIAEDASGLFLRVGEARDDSWSWGTIGGVIYASGTTGGMTQTAPTASGAIVQIVGKALSATKIAFMPDQAFFQLT